MALLQDSLRINIHDRPKSRQIYANACEVIASGVNSPMRAFSNLGMDPVIVRSGSRDEIIDEDGNFYVDFCNSWGALILGHCQPDLMEAALDQMKKGSTFGIATEIEYRAAQKICELMSIEKLRFVSTGTEATMSALRVARAYTKKEYIVKFAGHYHGHSDQLLVQAGSGLADYCSQASSAGLAPGAVQYTLSLPYHCLDSLQRLFSDSKFSTNIAAVILEPVPANMGTVVTDRDYLQLLRQLTFKHKTLLIFDEVITGFRLGLGGAIAHYEIEPDLVALGKVIGGGFPAAAFGGRAEIMDHLAPKGGVYQAGTLSGNPVAMAAGLKTIEICQEEGFYENLEYKTRLITDPVKELIEQRDLNCSMQQIGSLFTLFFGKKNVRTFEDAKGCDLNLFRKFYHYMLSQGIYLAPSQFEANFISAAHKQENLIKTRDLIIEFLHKL